MSWRAPAPLSARRLYAHSRLPNGYTPVLAAVADGAPLALSALRERITNEFQLSEAERHERLPSGRQTVINNREGWAHTFHRANAQARGVRAEPQA